MDQERYQYLKDIVGQALELSEFERDAFLQAQCEDHELLAEARDLLLHHRSDTEVEGESSLELPEMAGQKIGPYQIIRPLGEGGMGVVYLAGQSAPLRRKVALKVIKLGMDTREVISRFASERQALAMMDHPNIAKVYDAGATDEGRPYFVMEYIPGVPLNHYCDEHKLGLRERLDLFIQVCRGVQHAHQKGIIHRDLKPGNILVAEIEGKAVPKIIDFGVAKATNQHLTAQTLFTQMGQLIGTPEYMSPEQAGPTGEDVDTRSDVYSLGVVLYELLTGVLPLARREIMQAGLEKMALHVQNEIPKKPSTRLDTEVKHPTGTTKIQTGDTRLWVKKIRGDLDWITMKALEKDRDRRYGTATDLAADIVRHLESRAVSAGPPSGAYRVGKFVRRNRAAVTLSLVALAALVGFAAWQTMQSKIIARERDKAMANERLSHARGEVEKDPTVALAFALSSLEIMDQPATRDVVRQAVAHAPIRHKIPRGGRRGNNLGVDTSPDGRSYAVSCSHMEKATVVIYSLEDYSSRVFEAPHHDELWDVVYNADGTMVAGLGYGGIQVWRVADGEHLLNVSLPDQGFLNIFKLADPGKLAFSSNRKGERTQWFEVDVADGSTRELGSSRGSLADQAFHIPAIDLDATRVIDFEDTRLYFQPTAELGTDGGIVLDQHEAAITSVAIDDAGETVASVDNQGFIKVWNLLSSPPEVTFEFKESPGDWILRFDPSGKRLMSSWGSEVLNVYELSEAPRRRPLTLLDRSWWSHKGAFPADGTVLTTGNGTGTSHWKTEYPIAWSLDLSDIPGPTPMAQVSDDGNMIYLWSTEGELTGMPLVEGTATKPAILGKTSGWTQGVWSSMAVDKNHNRCLTYFLDSGTEILDLDTGKTQSLPGLAERHILWSLSPDSRYAGMLGFPETNKFFVYDLDSLKTVATIDMGTDSNDEFFLPGNNDLLVMGNGCIVKFDITNPEATPDTLWQGDGNVEGEFLGDGEDALVLDEELDLTLVHLADGRSEVIGKGPKIGGGIAADYHRESGLLAVGGWWKKVMVFDLKNGEQWNLPVPGEGSKLTSGIFIDLPGQRLISFHSGNIIAWKLPLNPIFGNPEHDELVNILGAMTNIRVVPDESRPTGFRMTTTQSMDP